MFPKTCLILFRYVQILSKMVVFFDEFASVIFEKKSFSVKFWDLNINYPLVC